MSAESRSRDHTTGRVAIDTFVWLSEQAFENDPHQSLMANLRRLRNEDWARLPPGGGRSIVSILEHVGWAKWMYRDYAFGSASLRGDQPPLVAIGGTPRPRDELLKWLRDGHRLWVDSVRALAGDEELVRVRLTNWGEYLPTRTIIEMLLAHDIYHAGEINHLRALLQGNDRWPYA